MLGVEHKSALLYDLIDRLRGEWWGFCIGFGVSLQTFNKYRREISCHMTQTLNAVAFLCVCSAQVFIRMRQMVLTSRRRYARVSPRESPFQRSANSPSVTGSFSPYRNVTMSWCYPSVTPAMYSSAVLSYTPATAVEADFQLFHFDKLVAPDLSPVRAPLARERESHSKSIVLLQRFGPAMFSTQAELICGRF